MRVIISGATGLVGQALAGRLKAGGATVHALSRKPGPDAVVWSPAGGRIDAGRLEGYDAVVHLAGEPIFGRWTEDKKRRIRESRVNGTRLLAAALASLDRRPAVLVCASAIGYYGNRGEETLTEESSPGDDFLARTCVEWEAAAEAAKKSGIRTAHMRFGVILSPHAGALKLMLPAFKMGMGGRLGGGEQWMSWITLDDAVRAIQCVLENAGLEGAFNTTAPEPVTNGVFTRSLGSVLRRPTMLPVPAFAARLALGELADAALLSSARVLPARLMREGFTFESGHLDEALVRLVGRRGDS